MALELLPRLRSAWSRRVSGHGGWTCLCGAVVGMVEALGRWRADGATDATDGLLLFLLVAVAAVTAWRHTRDPVPWWSALMRGFVRLGRVVQALDVDVGVDLRRDPPFDRGWPPSVPVSAAVLAVLLAVAGLFHHALPAGLRVAGLYSSYVLYLIVLGALWAVLLASCVGMTMLAVTVAGEAVVRAGALRNRRSPVLETTARLGMVALVLVAALWLPAVAAAVGVVVLLLGHFLLPLVPGSPRLLLLWRSGSGSACRTIAWDRFMASEPVRAAVAVLAMLLLARGAEFSSAGDAPLASMPVTAALGQGMAWASLAGLAAMTVYVAQLSLLARLRDPARPREPELHLAAGGDPAARRALLGTLCGAGFRVRTGRRPRRGAVRLELPREGRDPDPGVRLVGPGELETPADLDRLRRRHEIAQRRLLVRGLSRLFKRAAGTEFSRGQGFWVAPHLWFALGLSRDEDGEDSEGETGTVEQIIGPRYDRLIPLSARAHFHEIMAGLEVDLLFVEDGVGFRRLRDVLRVLFEVHDVHGGAQPLLERHLAGIPGVRCMLHDVGPEGPFRLADYPEPDYEGVGRARVLHVFRDRGDPGEDPVAQPSFDHMPVLV